MDEGDYRAFADCFVEYEEREDEEGETYTVAIPIQSLNMVYGNLAAELNQEVSLEDKTNVQRIYMLAKYGVSVPDGNGLPPQDRLWAAQGRDDRARRQGGGRWQGRMECHLR